MTYRAGAGGRRRRDPRDGGEKCDPGDHTQRTEGARTVANFPVEVRFVPADEAWLSPAEGADTCQLGVYATDGVGATRLFDELWDKLGRDRTRAHWGKELDHTAEQIAGLYPRLGDFRGLRDELDPDRVFGGPFLTQVLGD